MDPNCIFCKIIAGTIPSYKIYEDDNYLAILDISQFTAGHTLVLPKKHYRFVWDVEDMAGYFAVAKKLANHYRELGYQFVDSMTFGRQVPHAHVHLLPHNGDDTDWNGALQHLEQLGTVKLTPEEGKELVAKLQLK